MLELMPPAYKTSAVPLNYILQKYPSCVIKNYKVVIIAPHIAGLIHLTVSTHTGRGPAYIM